MATTGAGFITIVITGQKETTRRLATWGAAITDLSPAWTLLAGDLRDSFMDQTMMEGGMLGRWSKWADLRPATIADRIRRGYTGPHPIEWVDGNQLRSLAIKGAPGNVEIITPEQLSVGSDWFTAAWQHYGTKRMVARPLVGISWKMKKNIINRLNTYIMDEARRQGLQATVGTT